MRKFDVYILKANISAVMKQKGVSRKDIEDLLDLSQPNVLRKLSDKYKDCFTLEQTFKIAEKLGTTVDELIGNVEKSENRSATSICKQLVALLQSRDIYHFEHKVEEHIYYPQPGYEYDIQKETVKYHAFYFPDYFSPPKLQRYEDQFEEMHYDAMTLGNSIKQNQQINMFLDRFIDNFDKYEGGFLDEATYKIVTEAFLNAIEEPNKKPIDDPVEPFNPDDLPEYKFPEK